MGYSTIILVCCPLDQFTLEKEEFISNDTASPKHMFGGLGLLEILRVPTEIAKHSVSVQPTES